MKFQKDKSNLIESKPVVVWGWRRGREFTRKGHEGTFRVMEVFYILIEVFITWVFKCVKLLKIYI